MNNSIHQRGLTLTEVLVAIVLLAVLLVPAVNALYTGHLGTEVQADLIRHHYRLVSRLETVLAEPYASLEASAAGPATPTSYSDAAGPPDRVVVFIAGYDADDGDADGNPFTDPDNGLLWVRVAIDESVLGLETLATR